MIKSIYRLIIRIGRKYSYYRRHIYVAPGSYVSLGVTIGQGTRINHISHLGDCDIGSYCAIGGRLVVRSTDHFTCYLNMQDALQKEIAPETKVAGKTKGRVKIGHGVWIGDSVILLPGVSIGNGAVIGAGSVVTKCIPDYSIAVGNPAKVIRYRFGKEKIDILKKLDWWNWQKNKMRTNVKLFATNLESVEVEELRVLYEEIN